MFLNIVKAVELPRHWLVKFDREVLLVDGALLRIGGRDWFAVEPAGPESYRIEVVDHRDPPEPKGRVEVIVNFQVIEPEDAALLAILRRPGARKRLREMLGCKA